MAIVETFLLEKLEGAIRKTPATTTSLSTMFHLHEDCNDLKDLIKEKMPKTGNSVIKENLYYLNNVMAEWHMLLEEHHHPTPEAIRSFNKLRGRLNQIKKDVQDVLKEKAESVKDGSKPDSEIFRWSSRSVDLSKVYGIEDKDMIMERLLVSEGFKAIGIVGMPGVGKTTLCQKVFDNPRVKEHFLPRIWVCLSKQPNIDDSEQELVKKILMGLGFERDIVDNIGKDVQFGLSRLLLALRLQLKRQRYLIVLDDAWKVDKDFMDFCSSLAQDDDKKEDRLHYGLPKRHGGAVIVTSRSPILLEKMVGEKNVHRWPLAGEESCWKIFKDAVEKDGIVKEDEYEKPPGDKKLRQQEIVKKCAGLPLTAKMLGQIEHDKVVRFGERHQSQTQQEP